MSPLSQMAHHEALGREGDDQPQKIHAPNIWEPSARWLFVCASRRSSSPSAGLRSGGATPLRADAPGAPGGASSSIEELRDVVRGLAGSVSSLEAQV